jgi:hypothetical protein
MAIKDIIVPGFVGTMTVRWLPTRGLGNTADVPAPGIGETWVVPTKSRTWTVPLCSRNWIVPTKSRNWKAKLGQ